MVFGSCFEEEQKEQMGFAHQEEMIKQFQALLEEVDETLKERFKKFHQGNCNPTETLIHFLKASDWNVQRAHKVLLNCLQWILQNNFDNVLAKPVIPIYRVVGDSQSMGLYQKEVYASFEHCKSYTSRRVEAALRIDNFERSDEEYKKIDEAIAAAGFIIIDDIPGLNVTFPSVMTELPRGREYVPMMMLAKCNACICVEDLLGEKMKYMKNTFGKLDFQSFPQGWKACDGNNVPPYLIYLHEELGGNVTATATLSEDMIALVRALFYAAIDEMHKMQLQDITNEDVILKWGCVMRDSKKMGLDVEFAEEHLKKIAHAYFLSKGPVEESNKEELCSMSERESFDDGAPLSKGLLLFAPSEHSA